MWRYARILLHISYLRIKHSLCITWPIIQHMYICAPDMPSARLTFLPTKNLLVPDPLEYERIQFSSICDTFQKLRKIFQTLVKIFSILVKYLRLAARMLFLRCNISAFSSVWPLICLMCLHMVDFPADSAPSMSTFTSFGNDGDVILFDIAQAFIK